MENIIQLFNGLGFTNIKQINVCEDTYKIVATYDFKTISVTHWKENIMSYELNIKKISGKKTYHYKSLDGLKKGLEKHLQIK